MSKKLLSIFFLLFIFDGFSQSVKSLLKSGDAAMDEKDYYSASQYYNRAILLDSVALSIQWKYAEASRLNYDFDEARHWYDKIFKIDNLKDYPEAPFWLGNILQFKGQYKEAKKYYDKYAKKFRNSKDKEKKKRALRAKMYADACDFAQVQLKNPVDVVIEHLDTNVNSKVSEYAPYEYDTTLYFSSLRNKGDRDKESGLSFNKLYIARKKANADSLLKEKENHSWKRAMELDSIFNKNGIHNANTCFNKDFTQIYISRCEQVNASSFSCKIYRSALENGKWSPLKELPAPINVSGENTTQANVGEIDGKSFLFFASSRNGGEGGLDIWYSQINSDGSFGAPVNAGKKVNTPEDEITPFFVNKTKTLYFSTTWGLGMGGFDIFKSEFKDNAFSEPVNVGYPINSSENDIYYSINSKKNKAYISSNRIGSYFEERPSCCNDIYAFSIPSLEDPPPAIDSVKIVVDQMKILCPLTLYFHNDEPNPKTHDITTKKTYKKTYDEYVALRPQYMKEYPKGKEGAAKEQAENRITNFMEDSVDAGMHDLEKFAALLEDVMKKNEKVKITMQGFCSPLASTDYNVNLAKRRVSSLRNYFLEYKNGMFVKYVDNQNPAEGRIEFFEEDVGELPTSKVSDDVHDTQNSVYSPGAARERKIQILAVTVIK
jgi:tetratricopeptide (TPR) repeat protein